MAVAADVALTQAADFDCPGAKRVQPFRGAGLLTDRVGQLKSAAGVNSVLASTALHVYSSECCG